jgi:hypothetical protein
MLKGRTEADLRPLEAADAMKTSHVATIVFAASVLALASLAWAAIKVQVDHDPEFDFSALKTWAWHPKGPGNAVKIITQEDDSAAFKRQVEPRLLPIVQAEFVRRGFAAAASGDPDFYVTYYAVVTAGNSSQFMGQFISLPKWGLPPLAPQTTSIEYFPRGALILDVTARATDAVVWRGVAQAEMKWEETEAKRDQRVREAVRELLKRFPPKPGKGRP